MCSVLTLNARYESVRIVVNIILYMTTHSGDGKGKDRSVWNWLTSTLMGRKLDHEVMDLYIKEVSAS